MVTPPYLIVPTTEAPSQNITITLNNQNCVIALYTKSTFMPVDLAGTTQEIAPAASFVGSITGLVLAVHGISDSVLFPDMTVYGNGVGNGTRIVQQLTGNTGGDGTYQVDHTQTVPAGTFMQTFSPVPYENVNPCFIDLYTGAGSRLIVGGVYVRHGSQIVRDVYLGFAGDLAVYDTTGAGEDPVGVPPVLPIPNLRNAVQLATFPLSDGDRAPPGVAGRIPGMGRRFLLTYWPPGSYVPGYPPPS